MNRNIPIGNKICATKEIFQNQVILNQHLLNMRPQINTSAPKQYNFLKNKAIKEAIKLQKQQEIDRENQNLISKLTNIRQQSANNSITTLPINKSSSLNVVPKRSLNKDHRKKELIKIVMENQQLLKRIQDQKSQYNVKDWNEERKCVEKHIASISEYPYKDLKPTKTLVQYWTNSRISETQMQSIFTKYNLLERDSQINKKLDPLVQSKSQQTKQRIRQDYNLEYKQLLFPQDFQQKQAIQQYFYRSIFESDFQPYEPYQDEVAKIVNELIEKPQFSEDKAQSTNQNNQITSHQNQQEENQQEIIESKQEKHEEMENKQQEQQEQEINNQDEIKNIQQNSHDETHQRENQDLNQENQNYQEIQTLNFDKQNDEIQDLQDGQEVQE
ncbi:unnamed protein product (macronuclear) [Paramecium tetraurelia]|uniref:Uncharacterized protein n=1 Tax=Paramecium tetraurelia TaxID=5888 RepID=A0CSV5_PARTE|nr:uncharacterized protein GSPATT00010144001 [Paramecium tetraurelia]CAK73872.1 unnamed protein product [Paramecium tetraurelia]|eukprot:XP_001441269.1 hypothetical protein (macronuclear) [Paramecium tetraurelia strain d4-2]